MSLLVNSVSGVCVCDYDLLPCVFKSCLLVPCRLVYSLFPVFQCVYLTLIVVIKDYILKYLLVFVFLVPPCCVHRDRRPDQTLSLVPSTSFCFVRFFKCFICSCVLSLAASESLAASPHARRSREFMPPFAALPSRGSREFYAAVRGSPIPPFAGIHAAVRGSAIPPFAGVHAAVRGSTSPPFAGDDDATVHG